MYFGLNYLGTKEFSTVHLYKSLLFYVPIRDIFKKRSKESLIKLAAQLKIRKINKTK